NGLQLAALPSELVGVLTGALLVGSIAVQRLRPRTGLHASERPDEEVPVKNSQVAILCGAILASGVLIAASNAWLVRSVVGTRTDVPAASVVTQPASAPITPSGGRKLTIAM